MTTNNEMKHTVLLSLEYLTTLVEEKIYLLRAIDCDTYEDGTHDLNDQIMTFTNAVQELKTVINRSMAIVPYED
jgi:hypothetical protein|tara:strand:+ start:513 stop:734 length:222 start_codon:yes stop_codon:yes gene_type:complete